jgi:hypothetical protein
MDQFQNADLSLLGRRELQVQRLDKPAGNPFEKEASFPTAFTSSSAGIERLERQPSALARLDTPTSRLDPWTKSATNRSVPEQFEELRSCDICRRKVNVAPFNPAQSNGRHLCYRCLGYFGTDDTASYENSELYPFRGTTMKMDTLSLNSNYEPGMGGSVRPRPVDPM